MRQIWPLLLAATATPAFGQVPPAPPAVAGPEDTATDPEVEPGEEEEEEIVVTASRTPQGSVVGDITPEVVLDGREIRAYGAASIGELLEELAPLTGSIQGRDGDGQPVVLLSGRRISSFREIRDLPPEAIARVDILPEEVALKYGYRADRKVVNIVLRGRFNAVTAELDALAATSGGRQAYEGDANYLRLAEGTRFSVDGELGHATPLFESERDIRAADADRTLLPATDSGKLNATYNRTVLGNVSATLSGEIEGENSRAALGRSDDGTRRLQRDRLTRTGNLNYALNGDWSDWRWSLDGGYTRDLSRTLTDRDAGLVARDRARSVAQTWASEATLTGTVLELPAGGVGITGRAGFTSRDIDSSSRRSGVDTDTKLGRDGGTGAVNLDVPLLARGAIGALSANLNGGVDQLSDFGTLTTLGYGFNWRPFGAVRLIGSVTHEEGAPTIQQLGNPVITTANVRVLDLSTGQTVDATVVDGGNPALRSDKRRVVKLGLTVKPITGTDLTLLANYTDTRISDPVASFPTATPEIEAAFPDRFDRDAAGRLVRIDSRPVNFERSRQRQLRWGLNWSETLEAPPPLGPDGQPLTPEQIRERREAWAARRAGGGTPGADGQRRGPGTGGGGGFRGFGGGGRGAGQGRVQLALFHTWRLEDTVRIRGGVPELDLLDGSSTGGRGGRPRHEIEFNAGYNRNGIGVRLSGNWQDATSLRGEPLSAVPSSSDLVFDSFFSLDLRVFADLGQQRGLVRAVPFLRGSRVTLSVANLLDERLEVRDATGATPLGYQGDLLDPLGRAVRVRFRKLFY